MLASPHLISGSWEVRRTPPVRYLASMFGNRLWRKRWPTCGATVRFYRLGDDYLRPSKAEAERRIDGDGADPDQGGDRREAIQDAALCSAILGSIISRRWAPIRLLQPRDIAMGEPVGLSSGPRSAKRPLGLCP